MAVTAKYLRINVCFFLHVFRCCAIVGGSRLLQHFSFKLFLRHGEHSLQRFTLQSVLTSIASCAARTSSSKIWLSGVLLPCSASMLHTPSFGRTMTTAGLTAAGVNDEAYICILTTDVSRIACKVTYGCVKSRWKGRQIDWLELGQEIIQVWEQRGDGWCATFVFAIELCG